MVRGNARVQKRWNSVSGHILISVSVCFSVWQSGSTSRGAKLPNRIHIEEAVQLYNERGWIQVWSTYLDAPIYLAKHRSTQVPDPTLSKYTQTEVKALKGLSLDELKTLHEAKVLFGGTIHEKEANR